VNHSVNRIGHYCRKIRGAWASGTLPEEFWRFLVLNVKRTREVLVGYARLSRADRRLNVKDGFADHRQTQGHHRSRPEDLQRILAAYKAAKLAQREAAAPFWIRGLWAEWIPAHYKTLIAALEAEDLESLGRLLENLFQEPCTAGLGGYEYYVRYRSPLGGPYIKYVWSTYRDKLAALGFDPRNVAVANVGNQVGVALDGKIVPIEALRHAYHAVEMRELLHDVPGAVCVEIGGGLGDQSHQVARIAGERIAKYVVFDIPEVAVISSYFLLSALPDRRIRLFGEGPMSVDSDEEYDIAVFPHYAITQLPDASVDLFYNSCSFSEMDSASSRAYLSVIERVCRRYFLHDNHDVVFKFKNHDGTESTNIIGSELVPDSAAFKRIFKKPRVHGLPEDRRYVQYEYLYEKIRPSVPATL
jgi:hypothetical protein